MTTSGLSREQRRVARKIVVHNALFCVSRRSAIHYTQDARRWEGIAKHRRVRHDRYPHFADCSAFVTWLLWTALTTVAHDPHDIVNGAKWRGGYTGTMVEHGARVHSHMLPGDAVFYGDQGHGVPEHVAVYIGGGHVVSHGSEGGPYILNIDYRHDRVQVRRYI